MYKIVMLVPLLYLLFLSGCTATIGSRCTSDMIRAGFFCYGGKNFGKNLTPMEKKGIIDGCRQDKVTFLKIICFLIHKSG